MDIDPYMKKQYEQDKKETRKNNFFNGLSNIKNRILPPKTPDQMAFEKELKQKTEEARRKTYLKESIRQSSIRGRMEANKKFNPQQPSYLNPNVKFMEGILSPTQGKQSKKGVGSKNSDKELMKMINGF